MVALALLLVLLTSAASDYLACAWQRARERRAYGHGAAIGALHELVQWTPVLLALEYRAPLIGIVLACVVGSVIGSLIGFRAAMA